MLSLRGVVAIGCLWLASCSSGSGSSGGLGGAAGAAGSGGSGGGGFDCSGVCTNLLSAGCDLPTMTDCMTKCEGAVSGSPQCTTEKQALVDCQKSAPVQCDLGEEAHLQGCQQEGFTLYACKVCEPQAADDPCDTCSKTNCCPQLQAIAGNASYPAFQICYEDCLGDAQCVSDCEAQFPEHAQKKDAFDQCMVAHCISVCGS